MNKQNKIEPGPGQESVWDYPRPPRLEASSRHIWVIFNKVVIADTRRAMRILETSHPPVYYIPPEDVRMEYLAETQRATYCEWKGAASYYTLNIGHTQVTNAAWFYRQPTHPYEAISNYIAFYPGKVDACFVDDERVQAQEGDFYGGWITAKIIGPFKGGMGTTGW